MTACNARYVMCVAVDAGMACFGAALDTRSTDYGSLMVFCEPHGQRGQLMVLILVGG